MKQSLLERSRPYLVIVGFFVIAFIPVISSGLFHRYPRIYLDEHLNEQLYKYAPLGSSTTKAINLMEGNGFECSPTYGENGPYTICEKSEWIMFGSTTYEISIYGPKVVKKFKVYAYH